MNPGGARDCTQLLMQAPAPRCDCKPGGEGDDNPLCQTPVRGLHDHATLREGVSRLARARGIAGAREPICCSIRSKRAPGSATGRPSRAGAPVARELSWRGHRPRNEGTYTNHHFGAATGSAREESTELAHSSGRRGAGHARSMSFTDATRVTAAKAATTSAAIGTRLARAPRPARSPRFDDPGACARWPSRTCGTM